jgi:hypothetical protein
MKFDIGPGVECDLPILIETRLLVQSQSGGGKTTLLRRILEQTHGSIQQIVIDWEGELVTLREVFDYIIAGKGGDCAADPRSAKLLAVRVLELGVSTICDLSELKAHDRIRFVRVFLEALIEAPRTLRHPVLVVIDEAHISCPEKGQAESAPAVIDLCARGRKRGLCALLATQRLSKLHKDAAAELRNVLIGATGLDIDQRRAGDVLGFEKADRLALRDLKWREFYAYGPALSPGVKLLTVGETVTANPKLGLAMTAPAEPSAKIRALLSKVADLPAEAEEKARTEADLRRELTETRRKLTLAGKDAPPPSEELIVKRIEQALAGERRANAAQLTETDRRTAVLERVIKEASTALVGVAERLAKAVNGAIPKAAPMSAPMSTPTRYEVTARTTPRMSSEMSGDLTGIRAGAVRILRELARRHPLHWTKAQVAQLTAFTAKGGTFGAYIGDLKRAGLIEVSGNDVRVTDAGLEAAGEVPDAPATHEEVMEMWRGKMRAGEYRLLEAIAEAGEAGIKRAALAGATEFTMTGGTFTAYIGTLRRNGLIEQRGSLFVPSPMLWPEAL